MKKIIVISALLALIPSIGTPTTGLWHQVKTSLNQKWRSIRYGEKCTKTERAALIGLSAIATVGVATLATYTGIKSRYLYLLKYNPIPLLQKAIQQDSEDDFATIVKNTPISFSEKDKVTILKEAAKRNDTTILNSALGRLKTDGLTPPDWNDIESTASNEAQKVLRPLIPAKSQSDKPEQFSLKTNQPPSFSFARKPENSTVHSPVEITTPTGYINYHLKQGKTLLDIFLLAMEQNNPSVLLLIKQQRPEFLTDTFLYERLIHALVAHTPKMVETLLDIDANPNYGAGSIFEYNFDSMDKINLLKNKVDLSDSKHHWPLLKKLDILYPLLQLLPNTKELEKKIDSIIEILPHDILKNSRFYPSINRRAFRQFNAGSVDENSFVNSLPPEIRKVIYEHLIGRKLKKATPNG